MKNQALREQYSSKLRTADEAVRMIRSGQRVFIGSSCGEPQHLVNALMDNARFFSDVEIVRLLSLEGSLISLMADEYKGHKFDEGFRADIIVENQVIIELKYVEKLNNAHKKQLLTYLRLTGTRLGFLLNFSEELMKQGITRTVNRLE